MTEINTPWGPTLAQREIHPGIICHSFSGGNCYQVDAKTSARIPIYMRRANGFYDAETHWAILAMIFPAAFPGMTRVADRLVADTYPTLWEAWHERKLMPGESKKRDAELGHAVEPSQPPATSLVSPRQAEPETASPHAGRRIRQLASDQPRRFRRISRQDLPRTYPGASKPS